MGERDWKCLVTMVCCGYVTFILTSSLLGCNINKIKYEMSLLFSTSGGYLITDTSYFQLASSSFFLPF